MARAHEVGNHINGHSREIDSNFLVEFSLEESRREELEADEFAAFVLSKLKAPLNDLIELMNKVDLSVRDEKFSTHPSQESRIAAIKSGYKKAGYAIENMISLSVTANDYLNKVVEYYSFGYD